jgi:hypothetical protein
MNTQTGQSNFAKRKAKHEARLQHKKTYRTTPIKTKKNEAPK